MCDLHMTRVFLKTLDSDLESSDPILSLNPQTDVNPSLVKAKYPWENPFSQKNVIFISVKVCYIFIFSKNFHFQKSCTHSALKGRKIWFDFVNHKMEKIYGRWVHFIKIKEYENNVIIIFVFVKNYAFELLLP